MRAAWIRKAAKKMLPAPIIRTLRVWPPVGAGRFLGLRGVKPVSAMFGFDRGRPIDRYYIEAFLGQHCTHIRGRVMEIGDNTYSLRFGGERITRSDVLHAVGGNPQATIVADLTCAGQIPSDTFDCIICTQTLQFILDTPAAIRTLHRVLKSRGVVLATVPGISQISRYDMDRWGEYWRFTTLSALRLFGEVFGQENVSVDAWGNVLAASAFLYGVSAEELREKELLYRDPDYELLIGIRAVKGSTA